MSDCELLELAAKAAGYKKYYSNYLGRDSFVTYDETYYSEVKERQVTGEKTLDWNPLTDDGDALRLAVNLGIDIEWRADGRVAAYRHANANGYCFTAFESSREDRAANVRRAIVRAAAEIGKESK